jgi:hypothetical protein
MEHKTFIIPVEPNKKQIVRLAESQLGNHLVPLATSRAPKVPLVLGKPGFSLVLENKVPLKKEKAQRKEAMQWNLSPEFLEVQNQRQVLDSNSEVYSLAKRQIMHKIYGYKSQDVEKDKYDPTKFVDYDFVCGLLLEKDFKCYYCSEPVYIFYNYVRENKQWTLERIDNSVGHNKDNVQVACLLCNLRRRTMHHERYLKTKQMIHVKKLE